MRNDGDLDQVATVELVKTGYILKVNTIGFANVQCGEMREREESKMTQIFHLNKE